MAETSDIQKIKESIKFWNVTQKEAANIDFHTDWVISKSRNNIIFEKNIFSNDIFFQTNLL